MHNACTILLLSSTGCSAEQNGSGINVFSECAFLSGMFSVRRSRERLCLRVRLETDGLQYRSYKEGMILRDG